MHISR